MILGTGCRGTDSTDEKPPSRETLRAAHLFPSLKPKIQNGHADWIDGDDGVPRQQPDAVFPRGVILERTEIDGHSSIGATVHIRFAAITNAAAPLPGTWPDNEHSKLDSGHQ